MHKTINSLLAAVAARQRERREFVEGPASLADIAAAADYLATAFGLPLPQALSDLWSWRDGVYFNGMQLYRPSTRPTPDYAANLIEINETFGPTRGYRYLHIGEGDDDAFVHNRDDGGWHIADRISLDSYERFADCDSLVTAILRKYLAA